MNEFLTRRGVRSHSNPTTSLAPDRVPAIIPSVLSRATREGSALHSCTSVFLSPHLSISLTRALFLLSNLSTEPVIKKLRSISSIRAPLVRLHGSAVRLCSTWCTVYVDVRGGAGEQGVEASVEHRDYYVRDSRAQGSPPWLVITLELASGSVAAHKVKKTVAAAG